MMKQALKTTLLAAAATLALSAQATVTWTYDSKISVVETATQNADNRWNYLLEVTNTDTLPLWYINFYTEGNQATNHATDSGFTKSYTQATSGGTWGLPGQADGYFVGFHNENWPATATFEVGGKYAFAFDVANKLTAPIQYGYWVQGDHATERFTAVGTATPAVPEPEAMAMLLAGVAVTGVLARRRQRTAA